MKDATRYVTAISVLSLKLVLEAECREQSALSVAPIQIQMLHVFFCVFIYIYIDTQLYSIEQVGIPQLCAAALIWTNGI